MNRFLIALCSLVLIGASAPAAAPTPAPTHTTPTRRTIVPEDLLRMAFLSTATISHDGTRVAFVVRRADLKDDDYHSNIWLAWTDGSRVVQLTRGDHDGAPVWSPDDRALAFVRAQSGTPQIFVIDPAGGEARQVSHAEGGVDQVSWSHDGTRFVFVATATDAKPNADIDWRALGVTPSAKAKVSDIRTLPWPRYRTNGAGYTYDKTQHVWTIGVDGTKSRQLTTGVDGETNPAWSPDDTTIVYNSTPLADPEGETGAMYVIPANGGASTKIPVAHYGAFAQAWSTDGKQIVFQFISAHDSAGLPALATVHVDGSGERIIAKENTVFFGDTMISDTKEGGAGCGVPTSDGSFITEISGGGGTAIVKLHDDNIQPARVDQGQSLHGEILDCSVSRDETRVALTALDGMHLPEIYVAGLDGVRHVLTHFNDALTDGLTLVPAEERRVRVSPSETVSYFIMSPPNSYRGKHYPVVLDIHGGPQTNFGNTFFHEFQVLAAHGYVVIFANPRGSTSYSYDYTNALSGNWGQAMYDDEMAVLKDAIATRYDIDANRVVVSGGSYGGYATLWMISHTNRFRAALAERPVSNVFTEVLSADFAAPLAFQGRAGTPQAWGPPLAAYNTLWQQSPLAHVTDVHTPLMLIHGDEDSRTPIAETLQEYEALKMLGKPVTLVQFPRENHDLSRTGEPIHRIERLHLMLDWFDRYTKQ